MKLLPLTASLLSLIVAAQANPAPAPSKAPVEGRYCCPSVGPKGLPIVRQQPDPSKVICHYAAGTDETCTYDAKSGRGRGSTKGCPKKALKNPNPPVCPIIVPPSGLFCCPPIGPNNLPLDRQQVGPFSIFCYYDTGTDQGCFYNPGSGEGGGPAVGCPTQAPINPNYPTACPTGPGSSP